MTPVKQEFLHDPENGVYGDCWRACIASLLDLPLSEVPHILHAISDPTDGHEANAFIQKFLAGHGLMLFDVPAFKMSDIAAPDAYHMIYGKSPRNAGQHAIIGFNGEPYFDPHPSDAMLADGPEEWMFGFLVSTCGGGNA